MEIESANHFSRRVLATDLEGTLIPTAGNAANEDDLKSLCRMIETDRPVLIYSTDQERSAAELAISSLGLPTPDAIFCNVGKELCLPNGNGQFCPSEEFRRHRLSHLEGTSIAIAIQWWAEQQGVNVDSILYAGLYAGDSANDLDALFERSHWVVVRNAEFSGPKQVHDAHRAAIAGNRLFLAERPATSGLLDGCRWFEFLPNEPPVAPNDLGAVPVSVKRSHFRVRAPKCKSVAVEIASQSKTYELGYEGEGYFSGFVPAKVGARYQFVLDGGIRRPDPTSRFQPNGVHGESEVINPQFPWSDDHWTGVKRPDLVIYEMHIGAFTEQGTFASAIERIPEMVQLGVTAIELMPVAQSPGKWNWGYDGVNLFAPRASFGTPDDFREFVDACHAQGLAVILDVVYNHLGPEGNYLSDFGQYYSRKHGTPWGEAFDFDGRHAEAVRRFIVDNALYWIRDFHLDGLRLDAVHFMFDDSDYTILDEIRDRVSEFREDARRKIHLIAEANVFDRKLAVGGLTTPQQRPYDLSWCDDIMHSIYSLGTTGVSLTRRPYNGASDVAEALNHGFIYTGPTVTRVTQESRKALNLCDDRSHLSSLVVALQTHDSVGNHPHGKRLHQLASVPFQKAAAALFLLHPATPMIFMGEEFAAESPFPFFVDFEDRRLRKRVDRGRAAEYPQHQWDGAISPSDPQAFYSAKCHSHSIRNAEVADWYRSLIALRKQFVQAGILKPQYFSVDADTGNNYFTLRYEDRKENRGFSVHARLQSSDHNQSGVIGIAVAGKLVLDSENREAASGDRIELAPNEAVVLVTHQTD
ncbi:malto-oligosyltrehalose trehalohydrolase [Planctomycetota bacterium]